MSARVVPAAMNPPMVNVPLVLRAMASVARAARPMVNVASVVPAVQAAGR